VALLCSSGGCLPPSSCCIPAAPHSPATDPIIAHTFISGSIHLSAAQLKKQPGRSRISVANKSNSESESTISLASTMDLGAGAGRQGMEEGGAQVVGDKSSDANLRRSGGSGWRRKEQTAHGKKSWQLSH
jgi:hypothetical protein